MQIPSLLLTLLLTLPLVLPLMLLLVLLAVLLMLLTRLPRLTALGILLVSCGWMPQDEQGQQMTMKVEWIDTGSLRVFAGLTQPAVNRIINVIAQCRDTGLTTHVKVTVTD